MSGDGSKKKEGVVTRSSPFVHSISICFASAAATVSLQPLDVVRTRLQVYKKFSEVGELKKPPEYKGSIHAFKVIWRNEGLRAFFSGVVPNAFGSAVSWLGYMYLYQATKEKFGIAETDHGSKILASEFAAITLSMLTNPIWLIKTRLQLQITNQQGNYKGFTDCFKTVVREEGFLGLYKGFTAAMIGTIHGTANMVIYEFIRESVIQYTGEKTTSSQTFIAGLISKTAATALTYPYQVIKSRLQARNSPYKGLIDAFSTTWRKEGISGFYRGLGPTIVKVTPNSAITFLVYEYVRSELQDYLNR